jgi:phosphohistidine phosphatase
MGGTARQLWLLRHADAEPHGTRPDVERRLTPRGERQARLAGVALARTRVSFAAALVSPKVRAQQTARLAVEAWGAHGGVEGTDGTDGSFGEDGDAADVLGLAVVPRTYEPLAGGFDAAQALDALAGIPADGRVLLVGHEPDLSSVVAELTGARIDLKKGGLAVVRLEGGAAGRRPASRAPRHVQSEGGGGELVVLLRPRELALIANLATADL